MEARWTAATERRGEAGAELLRIEEAGGLLLKHFQIIEQRALPYRPLLERYVAALGLQGLSAEHLESADGTKMRPCRMWSL